MIKKNEVEPYIELSEMAKNFPAGSIVKVITSQNLGDLNGKPSPYYPDREAGAEGGFFFLKVSSSGRMWLDGSILFPNCLNNSRPAGFYRAPVSGVEPAGELYKQFEKVEKEIKELKGKKLTIDGDEDFILGMEGRKKEVTSGEYMVIGVNWKLTEEMKTPVLYLSAGKNRFCATLENISGDTETENSEESKKILAEWISNKLSIDIEWNEEEEKYIISTYFVKGMDFSAGPFATKEIAESLKKTLEEAIEKTHPMLVDVGEKYRGLRVEKSTSSVWILKRDASELVEIAKEMGVKIPMKELLRSKKGAIGAKKLGLF